MPILSEKAILMPASPIRKLVPYSEKAKTKGTTVYHLNIGQPDIETPEVALNAVKNLDRKVIEYSHSAGFESYRNALSAYYVKNGIDQAIARGLAYAPYCDLIWCETDKPDLAEAKKFAEAIHAKFPGKLLAYNCSPSFNWKKYLTESEMQTFQQKLGDMGYKFQFITLAGFHVQNYSVFTFAQNYKKDGMAAYSKIQQQEFEAEKDGYTAVKHQREVGASYFDNISQIISAGQSSTTAMSGSTESEQF